MAVGRYQHAHAASTYSYALALSRSPSPSSRCSIPFCNLLTLSSFRRLTFLSRPPLSHVSLFFPPSQPFAPIIILPSLSVSVCCSLFSSKHYLSSFLFLLISTLDFDSSIFCYRKPFLQIFCRWFSLHVLPLSL